MKLTAVCDDYFFGGFVARLGGEVLDFADQRFAIEYFTEDDVLSVEMGSGNCGDEELGAIGACVGYLLAVVLKLEACLLSRQKGKAHTRTSIGHGQQERLLML